MIAFFFDSNEWRLKRLDMYHTIKDVQKAFLNGQALATTNLISTGNKLISYGWYELAQWVDGKIITRKGKMWSITTAKHIGPIRRHPNTVEAYITTDISDGEMQL